METVSDFTIRIMTLSELARYYDSNLETMQILIEPIRSKLKLRPHVRVLTVWQVKMIVDYLGPPSLRITF
jgi:hypothetical protein